MPQPPHAATTPPIVLQGVIAVIGADGSGKSTLTSDLIASLRDLGPVQRFYLGLVSGEMGEKIKQLPLIGVRLEAHLAQKAQRAQDRKHRLPGTGTGLVMYILSLWRARQFRRLIALSRRGVTVITDRYPQAEIAGFRYDGPALPGSGSENWLIRRLAAREQRLYERMASHLPALVIRLNIDAETAAARKPDHDLDELRDKISVAPRLRFNGARIVEVDARLPYEQVLGEVLRAVNGVLRQAPASN